METLSARLESKVGVASLNPIGCWDVPIVIDSVQVWFETKPDAGYLDVGTEPADPDSLIDHYDLTTLTNHVVVQPSLLSTSIPAGTHLWAKVSAASIAAGNGGGIAIQYHRV
jgi:hypothetical protein